MRFAIREISTVVVLLLVAVLTLSVMQSGFGAEQAPASSPDQGYMPSPTLAEVNAERAQLGLPPMERLPWINPETGRNIYEERQEELDSLGIEGYRAKYLPELNIVSH